MTDIIYLTLLLNLNYSANIYCNTIINSEMIEKTLILFSVQLYQFGNEFSCSFIFAIVNRS